MFANALIALDLAPAEQPIIDCLPELRNWGVQRVTLTHVIQLGYMQGAALAHEQDYVAWLRQLAEPLRTAGLDVHIDLRASGTPADEILAAADEHAADLIVIGSRGHNLVSRLFLGSAARDVIRRTKRPVLLEWIEPSAAGTQQRCEAVCSKTLGHVLLATDFSEAAGAAELAAIHLASKADRMDCVYVSESSTPEAISESAAQAALGALQKRIEAAGSSGEQIVLHGKASAEIAAHASAADVTLIIVGKHGQNALSALLIGSTAVNVCEIAGRPVLMVP